MRPRLKYTPDHPRRSIQSLKTYSTHKWPFGFLTSVEKLESICNPYPESKSSERCPSGGFNLTIVLIGVGILIALGIVLGLIIRQLLIKELSR